ncbi:ERF family protein [Antarcticirhabdus aurantiaca]|uniref:ERF family protein n=1 Tax=Antarcticirhabdus aurantiaca TaxID=2606717 RepID=A0ACD4NKX9_9HYPH|nr:ERF family protein [Jeongeuplla avenae]
MTNALRTIEGDGSKGTALTPMDMLHSAVSSGANIETLEKLLNLQERWEKNQARKAFDNAMASLTANPPEILKNREVDYTSNKGRTNYRHEDLAGVTRALSPAMGPLGLSFRWRTDTSQNGTVAVTCIISHRDGHSEETTLSAAPDQSGGKNSIQAIGSAVTYLQRYTLKAALGIAASDDDDGRAFNQQPPAGSGAAPNRPSTITEAQVGELRDLIREVGANEARFLALGQLERLEDMRAQDFVSARDMLRAKGRKS